MELTKELLKKRIKEMEEHPRLCGAGNFALILLKMLLAEIEEEKKNKEG